MESSIASWFRGRSSVFKSKGRRRGAALRSRRPKFEQLEDRTLLSATLQLRSGPDVRSYAGVGFEENAVAVLYASLDGAPATNPNAFSATINWGVNGASSTGDLVYTGTNGSFATYLVKGSHVYQTPNGNGIDVRVSVTGLGTSVNSLVTHAYVSAMPSGFPGKVPAKFTFTEPQVVGVQFPYAGGSVYSYAGVGFQRNAVTTVYVSVDGEPATDVSKLRAQINWGDSSDWTNGELVYTGTNGSFAVYQVKGSHVYSEPDGDGNPILVYVNGPDGTSATGTAGRAIVRSIPSGIPGTVPPTTTIDAAPQNVRIMASNAGTFQAVAGIGFEPTAVAKLSVARNGQPETNSNSVKAWINWGDSANWTRGDLVFTGTNGSFANYTVMGSHTYTEQNGDGFPILVYATGPDGTSTSEQGSRAIVRPPVHTLGDLVPAQGMVNRPYIGTIQAPVGEWSWRNLRTTGLPSELRATLSGNLITISGTPTRQGPIAFTVSVQRGAEDVQFVRTYTLTIRPADSRLTLTPSTLPNGTAGQLYQARISASGGSGNYRFSLATGSTLPSGLQLLANGTLRGTVTAAGSYRFTVQASDATQAGLAGSRAYTLNIQPAAVARFELSAPSQATAGVPFQLRITATDRYGNRVTGYRGGVTLTSSDGQRVAPGTVALSGGSGTVNVTLTKAHVVRLTATAGASSGTSNSINVNASSPVAFTVNVPASVAAGIGFRLTITANDRYGNTATSFRGSVAITSSDGQRVTPSNVVLTGGTGTFTAILSQVNVVRLTATAGTIQGTSTSVQIVRNSVYDVSGVFWQWQRMAMMDQLQKHIAGGPNDPFPELKGDTRFLTEYDRLAAVWDNTYFHDAHNSDSFLFADGTFNNRMLTGHEVNYYFQGMAAAGYNRSLGQTLTRVRAYYLATHHVEPPANVLFAATRGFNNYAADLSFWKQQTASGTRALPPQPPRPVPRPVL